MKSTGNIKVSDKIVDQVIGQDEAVKIIKKAAQQRRHVLLIGEPGTGKSMLGLALAELLPNSDLKDILAIHNPNDENNPLIQELPAGTGREEVKKGQLDGKQVLKNNNFILFIVAIFTLIAPWWVRHHYQSDIMFAAFFLGGMMFLGVFAMMLSMGPRMFKNASPGNTGKVIVDNFGKKQAPFFDATGAHAGALLGDCLHDPFQTFHPGSVVTESGSKIKEIILKKRIDPIIRSNKNRVYRKEKNNYEAVFLPKGELTVLGENNNSVSCVEVLSSNRYDYNGEMIKLTTSKNKELIVTPEHAVAILKNGKISYVEAKDIKKYDEVVSKKDDLIIDEQEIINTYDERQQKLAKSYYDYLELKKQNPSWGHKKLATKLGISYGRTRWWKEKASSPVPIQTIEWLKERKLLPLRIDNPKLPLIAKILGATFGDGGIFENLNGIFLSSSEKEAVKEFGLDLEKLFQLKKNENSRIIEGGEYGHSWCYQNANRNIIRFFIALGGPKGKKTNQELKFPEWIKLKNSFEKEFYGSFLGNELGTPIIHKNGNYLTTLEVGISSTPNFKENRLALLNQLNDYLSRNRIKTTSIYQGKSKTKGNLVYRLLIEKKIDNVMLFLMNTKINYCKYKVDRLYLALGKWADLKIKKYGELIESGKGAEHAMKILNLTPNSLYLLLNHFGPKQEELST